MRLWHIDIIKFLPKSQLIAQWRELNSIYKNSNKHILINYIYNYDKSYLLYYSNKVIDELNKRKINITSLANYNLYFKSCKLDNNPKVFKEHNNEYLQICYYNLKEKFLRGQSDFTSDNYVELTNYINFILSK